MAYADYVICDGCGRKAIYDGGWEMREHGWQGGVGEMVVLCAECVKQGCKVQVVRPVPEVPHE